MGNWLKYFQNQLKKFKKYRAVFKISWQNNFVYRLNFIMWRVRNVLGLLALYFLWTAIANSRSFFSWNKDSLITYVIISAVVQDIVFSSQTAQLAGKINSGEISQLLLKPISILKFSFSVDAADKALNLIFSLTEILILFLLLKPPLILQINFIYFLFFGLSLFLSIIIYFFINFLLSIIGFWTPEVWAPRFIFGILLGFVSGSYYPLDILPKPIYVFFKITPFNYLIFFPLQIWLTKITFWQIIKGIGIDLFWLWFLFKFTKYVWKKGLKKYEAWGI